MHDALEAENGITFMASDTPEAMPYTPGDNFSLSLSGDDVGELTAHFEKLAAGGKVGMPLEKAPLGGGFSSVVPAVPSSPVRHPRPAIRSWPTTR